MKAKALRRWAPWVGLVIVFSLATTALSWWQFTRREERVEKIALVLENYEKAPVPLTELDWLVENGLAVNEWRQVRVTGNYLADFEYLVRNRPLSGQAGFIQLVAFRTDSGQIVMIDRGWIPAGNPVTSPAYEPKVTVETKELVIRLRASEPNLKKPEVQGQLASINFETLTSVIGEDLELRYYGRLASESPQSEQMPIAMPMPSLNEGNHLSYALQWILFGIMAFIALFWAIGNERRIQRELAGEAQPKRKKQSQAEKDAAVEDAG